MRYRELTLNQNLDTSSDVVTTVVYTYHPEWNSRSVQSAAGQGVVPIPLQVSEMSDSLSPPSHKNPWYGKNARKRIPPGIQLDNQGGISLHDLRPVNKCFHTKTDYSISKDWLSVYEGFEFEGNLVHERYRTRTAKYPNFVAFQKAELPGTTDLYLGLDSLASYDPLPVHDWFALVDSFQESLDQFVPSSMLLGETLIEHRIFFDAFKILVNPSSALKTLLSFGRRRIKQIGRLPTKQAVKVISKDIADANLGYQFGVKPAISDIVSILNAHRKVASRMEFLARNGGRYIPVRVRQVLPGGYTNPALPTLASGEQSHLGWYAKDYSSVATIGCYARVREDLNWMSTWTAYLQYFGINKIAGLGWELIPFSFILDWFTNFQERINTETRLRVGGPFTEIRGLWSSVKKDKTEELLWVPGYNPYMQHYYSSPGSRTTAAIRRITEYSRDTTIPDQSGVVDLSSLGLFHYTSGASILIQRWK